MRKTLTSILIVLAAGSLAACKMFWEKDETPPPAPVATTTEPSTPDATGVTEPTKPADQTASTDKAATPGATPTSPPPATK